MIPICSKSRIEIWSSDYIDQIEKRIEKDKNARIVQIEHGNNNDYIVEVVDKDVLKKEEEK